MAILTSSPGAENEVKVYDVPDDVLAQYAMTAIRPRRCSPKKGATAGIPNASAEMSPTKVENAESLGEVQAYSRICVCRELLCNPWRCWWHYYYCYC
jgi:hypothetical protein